MKAFLAGLVFCGWVAWAEPGVVSGEFGARRKTPSPPTNEGAATNKPAASNKQAAPKGYPFHGVIDSFEADGSSLSLKGKARTRQILVGKETRISRDGKNCPLTEAISGERVTGTVFRNAEGKEQARTVRFGGTNPAKKTTNQHQ
jgi:hypothetical protein